ncbi:YaaC family protein [Streptomyces phaeochromogenes]|uniref:YaaC family protein n=1 Tax=Streptomyces phaeochromogenes TaxID=1923 RepID=UPI002251F202|nr:YaaC family protein [Streptomyces phaeochromogenes]MCX5605394.1 YaaC family protein [Streptomyces phaeochromogenes]
MPLPSARPYTNWVLPPLYDPSKGFHAWSESASFPLLLESLRRHAEIKTVGRSRFPGPLSRQNSLWKDYRNFLRQALSNFEAAITVPNRSACLLYYYAMLNFAKAELLSTIPSSIIGQRVGHGLSFSPSRAKSVAGDHLTVVPGVFPWLYEARTGQKIAIGTKIPVKRLLTQIPEISTQVTDAEMGECQISALHHMIAIDQKDSWSSLLIEGAIASPSVTEKLLLRHFREVTVPNNWRDHFAISRRSLTHVRLFESIATFPKTTTGGVDVNGTLDLTYKIGDILGARTSEHMDAILCPSLYKTKMFSMPASLARYAVSYYASSLVRYKPSVFDSQISPEQAYMFDAIARECALPMLIDTLSGLEGEDQFFFDAGTFRN